MSSAIYPALFFTVALLLATAYFLLGGIPLLILKHDTVVDARFVRSFFNVYYKIAIVTALGACASYALWGRFAFAVGTGAIVMVAWLLRRKLLPAMHELGARIQGNDDMAIRKFRQVHSAALFVNLVQLVVLVWSTTKLSL